MRGIGLGEGAVRQVGHFRMRHHPGAIEASTNRSSGVPQANFGNWRAQDLVVTETAIFRQQPSSTVRVCRGSRPEWALLRTATRQEATKPKSNFGARQTSGVRMSALKPADFPPGVWTTI